MKFFIKTPDGTHFIIGCKYRGNNYRIEKTVSPNEALFLRNFYEDNIMSLGYFLYDINDLKNKVALHGVQIEELEDI